MVTLVTILTGVFALLIGAGVAWYGVSIYNRLVRVDERCENAWSNVDVVLKQRRDVLEKLVDTARETMDYERETFQQLVEAREAVRNAETPPEHAEADAKVRTALGALNVNARAEAYPDLGAVRSLQSLQDQIATLEESIADRRELYNGAVTSYNTIVRQFPYVVLATRMGYERRELFEAPEAELADVDVGELFSENAPQHDEPRGEQDADARAR